MGKQHTVRQGIAIVHKKITFKRNQQLCYCTCNSDTEYSYHPHMEGVFFITFLKLRRSLMAGFGWWELNLMRKRTTVDMSIANVLSEVKDTQKHPDPIPALSVSKQVQ